MKKRIISFLLVLCLLWATSINSLAYTYLAAISNQLKESEGSTLVLHSDIDQYYLELTGQLRSMIDKANEELTASSEINTGNFLIYYAEACIIVEWVRLHPISADGTTYYTLFDIPDNADGTCIVDKAVASSLINDLAQLYVDAQDKYDDLFSDTWEIDSTGDKLSVTSVNEKVMFSALRDFLADETFLQTSAYHDTIVSILADYCDKNILAVVASEIESSGNEDVHEINGNFCEAELDLVSDDKKCEEVISTYKEKLLPYTDVYNEIVTYQASMNGNTLGTVTIDNTEYKGYYYEYIDSYLIEYTVSETTKAIHAKMYANTSTTPAVDTPSTDDTQVTIDTNNGALNLMSNAKILNNQIVLEGDPELKNIGYAILAAGSIYDPFVSTAGNDDFINVITEKFLSSDEQADDLVQVLQVAINTKKPLYYTSDDSGSWKTSDDLSTIDVANYRQATLATALDAETKTITAYAVIKGSMAPSAVDASTWEYANYGTSGSYTPGSIADGVIVSSNDASGQVATNTTTEVSASSSASSSAASSETTDTAQTTVTSNGNAYVTVGGTELSGNAMQMTLPVMITAGAPTGASEVLSGIQNGFAAAVGGLTEVILQNASMDVNNSSYIQNASAELLYMNGLGDIVLANDIVVLPAIANPLLYNYGDDYAGLSNEDFANLFTTASDDVLAYYPYTAAFMNHYPEASISEDGTLSITSTNDENKWVICVDGGTIYAKQIKEVGSSAKITMTGGIRIAAIQGASFSVTSDIATAMSVLCVGKGNGGFNFQNVNWGWAVAGVALGAVVTAGTAGLGAGLGTAIAAGGITAATGAGVATYQQGSEDTMFITKGSAYSVEVGSFFPLDSSSKDVDDSYLKKSGPLITSALRYISSLDEVSNGRSSNGRFRVDHYIINFCGEGMLGSQYSEVMEKNNQVSYDDIVEDTGGRFLKFLVQVCDSAIDNLGSIDGVLAFKGPYSNSFFNIIMQFIQNFYVLIAAILMIIVAVKFLKGHYNFIYVTFMGLLCIFGFEVYANYLPTFIPAVYNFAVNDIVEQTVWDTVAYKAEAYEDTYKDSDRTDATTGALRPYTATITLYSLTNAEMQTVCERTGATEDELKDGKAIYLDQDSGIFIQGNEIKMSIDKLFVNNSMRGLYQSQWENLDTVDSAGDNFIQPITEATADNPYSIQLVNASVSLEAYYTPYDHIERAFLENLDTFASIFRIERATVYYEKAGIYKDSFLVSSYLRSGIVTAPGNEEVLRQNISINSTLGGLTLTSDDIVELCTRYFNLDNPVLKYDWLNIHTIFEDVDEGIKNSLWGYLMQKRGWYDNNWNMTDLGNEKISEMIYYIDVQTLVWIAENTETILYCSDENAVKLISLYATTCFTNYISQFGEWMYPNYINASDIQLRDALYGSMTTIKDRNLASDGTVTNTVALNLGIFGVIFIMLITLLSVVFVFIVTYLAPILYAMFGAILIFKFVNDEQGTGLVKGYIKVTATTAVLYTVYSLSMKLVRIGGYQWYGYLGCALVMFLCCYFLFWAVISVIQDPMEMGNKVIAKNLLRGLNKLTGERLRSITATTVNVVNRGRARFGRGQYGFGAANYTRNADIDDYGMPAGSRHTRGGYEAYSHSARYDEEEYTMPRRSRTQVRQDFEVSEDTEHINIS